MSASMSTRSPTITPPVSSTWFHVSPKSLRSIDVFAVNAARTLPHGSFAWPCCSTWRTTSRVIPLSVNSPTTSISPSERGWTRFPTKRSSGWRVAETLRKGFPWDSEDDWRAAGARLHTIQGLVRAEVTRASLSPAAPGAEGIWHDSYEAEQHLLHLGQADEPVCWTLVGFASGYMSCVYGKEVIAIEDRCRGKGDAVCRAVVRAKEEWGPELAMHLSFYQKACLDSALTQ